MHRGDKSFLKRFSSIEMPGMPYWACCEKEGISLYISKEDPRQATMVYGNNFQFWGVNSVDQKREDLYLSFIFY